MSNPIHHLNTLHNNPFIFGPAFTAFFEALGSKEKSLLLGYLVLPMVLPLPNRQYLKNANKSSSLRTMRNDKTRLHGVEDRVQQYRQITNSTIQYLVNSEAISIWDELSVVAISATNQNSPSPEGLERAAKRLGIMFQPYDVPTIYRMLGVMSL